MRALAAFAAAGLMIIAFRAGAQEDLEKGKSGAQIFATDCAICHKTPQAVMKGGAPGEGFLRQHYTTSREGAASVAAYLRAIRRTAAPEPRTTKSKSPAKPAGEKEANPVREKGASGIKQAQPANAKPLASEPKPAASEPKPAEKASDGKAIETRAPEKKEETKKPE